MGRSVRTAFSRRETGKLSGLAPNGRKFRIHACHECVAAATLAGSQGAESWVDSNDKTTKPQACPER